MQKVRIGNDIRISVSLADKSEYSATNIRNIKCYLVNKTLAEQPEKKCCKDPNLLNLCECHVYHVLPNCEKHIYCEDKCEEIKQKAKEKEEQDKSKYLTESEIDAGNNVINAYFPAKDQICGTYQLIVVVETYVPGWGKRELKMNTIDYGEMFEIVEDGVEQTSGVTITASVDTLANSGFIGYLAVRPFSVIDEDDQTNGFDRTDDGFESSSQETYNSVGAAAVDTTQLLEVEDLSKYTTVVNYVDGQYLWVVTKRQIRNLIDEGAHNIPFTTAQYNEKTGYYYYAGSNPLLKNASYGGASIKVIF